MVHVRVELSKPRPANVNTSWSNRFYAPMSCVWKSERMNIISHEWVRLFGLNGMIDVVDGRDMSLRVHRLGEARVASGRGRNRRQIINALKADGLEGEMERKAVIDDCRWRSESA
jgi:hypothetical protein